MKKAIVTVIIFYILSNLSFAQKIAIDKLDSTNIRTIISSNFNIYTKLTTAGSACLVYNEKYGYFLSLTLNEGYVPQIEKGRKLLLKFENGNILELKNKSNIESFDYTFYARSFGSGYLVNPIYKLSKEDIDKISNNNVIKIRI